MSPNHTRRATLHACNLLTTKQMIALDENNILNREELGRTGHNVKQYWLLLLRLMTRGMNE